MKSPRSVVSSAMGKVIVILLVATTSVALADPFDRAYDDGTTAFEAKDYPKARAEFLRAYDLRPEAIVLYNIAQTYRLENNAKLALEYYKRYLADSQATAELRQKAEDYVTRLEAMEKKVNDPTPIPEPIPTPPTPLRDERVRRIPLGSKIAAGVGGAGLLTSLVLTKLGLDAEHDFKDLRAAGSATANDSQRVRRYQNLINVSWSLTGIAAASAVAIYFIAPRYSTERRAVVVAPLAEGGVTASFGGRF